MAARLRFFGAEGGTETVDFTKCENVRLVVQLAGLGKIGKAFVEIRCLKESRGTFRGGRSKNGCVQVEEAVAVQVFPYRGDDPHPDAQNGPLARHANPQMAVIECKIDPVIL